MTKKTANKELDDLSLGEVKYVARVKMMLNQGRLHVLPGDVVILGPDDVAQGVHVDLLEKNGSIVRYESEEQAAEIRKWWDEVEKSRRESIRPRRK